VILLFLKRRFLLIFAGLLLSLIPGLFNYLTKGREFYSSMIVRANFGSVHDLYNKVDYFNSLITLGDNKKLADLLDLTEDEAAKLDHFEIEPVDDELQKTELYKSTFFDQRRALDLDPLPAASDTNWQKVMKYEDFKAKLTNSDYPMQKIGLYSLRPEVFSHAGQGLISAVATNQSLEQRKVAEDSILHEQTSLLLASISSSDSLMRSYNRKIAAGDRQEAASLSITSQATAYPEIQLFDKQSDLRRRLFISRREYEESLRNILQVYSDFSPTGQPISPFKTSFLQYSLWCLLGTIALLLVFEGYLKLDRIEKQRKNAKAI
jgi:hypothetical protein